MVYFLIFLTSSSSALNFYEHENNSKTLNAIMATGNVKYDDVEKLDRYLSKLPHKKHTAIYLDSPGGNLAGGIRLGRYFKQNKIKTVIQGYKTCASACALAFLGGTDYNGNKWMSSTTTSRLGFHAFSSADGTRYANSDETQQIVAEILKYGLYVNAPMDIFIKNFSTPSDSIYWFSLQEELGFGIKVWDIQNKNYVQSGYSKPKTNYTEPKTHAPSSYQQSTTDFIREYFSQLKQVPYSQTWNMLSNSMKQKASLSQYTNWWDGHVSRIVLLNTKKLNQNTVQATLKYYMKNGKVVCSRDTFTLQSTNGNWLIGNQKSKSVGCR